MRGSKLYARGVRICAEFAARVVLRTYTPPVLIKYRIKLEKTLNIAMSLQFPVVNEINITHLISISRMETDISSTLHPAQPKQIAGCQERLRNARCRAELDRTPPALWSMTPRYLPGTPPGFCFLAEFSGFSGTLNVERLTPSNTFKNATF